MWMCVAVCASVCVAVCVAVCVVVCVVQSWSYSVNNPSIQMTRIIQTYLNHSCRSATHCNTLQHTATHKWPTSFTHILWNLFRLPSSEPNLFRLPSSEPSYVSNHSDVFFISHDLNELEIKDAMIFIYTSVSSSPESFLCILYITQIFLMYPIYLSRASLCCVLCCSVLQCIAVYCSVFQCGAVWCSVVQCGAVCRSVLQCVAVCCSTTRIIQTYPI